MPGYNKLHLPYDYEALTRLDARGIAWEWLRRNPEFRATLDLAAGAVRRSAAAADSAIRRSARPLVDLPRHPLAGRWSPGDCPFAPGPDTPATQAPATAWRPELDASILTVIRSVPWTRAVPDLRFHPEQWGDRVIRIAAPGGTHLIVRRHGSPELSLWLPAELAPTPGAPFGLYLHPDKGIADRARATTLFRRAIGLGVPIRATPHPQAHRHAVMLYLYDYGQAGATLLDMAEQLLDPMPAKWRESSERSDLRRLLDAGPEMVAGGYRRLLGSRSAP